MDNMAPYERGYQGSGPKGFDRSKGEFFQVEKGGFKNQKAKHFINY